MRVSLERKTKKGYAHTKKGSIHGNPKGYNQGRSPCMLLKSSILTAKKRIYWSWKRKEAHACMREAHDCHPSGDHGFPSGNNQALLKSSILTACMQAVKIEDFKSAWLFPEGKPWSPEGWQSCASRMHACASFLFHDQYILFFAVKIEDFKSMQGLRPWL